MVRSAIASELKREVLMEAGYRCAIPACKQIPADIAHIIPYRKTKIHTFDNLIALCANCHRRYDNREIDRKAMIQYKKNLSIINNRYSDFEQRIMQYFIDHPNEEEVRLSLSGNMDIQIMNLIRDGYLELVKELVQGFAVGIDPDKVYRLTIKGRDFIQNWTNATDVE